MCRRNLVLRRPVSRPLPRRRTAIIGVGYGPFLAGELPAQRKRSAAKATALKLRILHLREDAKCPSLRAGVCCNRLRASRSLQLRTTSSRPPRLRNLSFSPRRREMFPLLSPLTHLFGRTPAAAALGPRAAAGRIPPRTVEAGAGGKNPLFGASRGPFHPLLAA